MFIVFPLLLRTPAFHNRLRVFNTECLHFHVPHILILDWLTNDRTYTFRKYLNRRNTFQPFYLVKTIDHTPKCRKSSLQFLSRLFRKRNKKLASMRFCFPISGHRNCPFLYLQWICNPIGFKLSIQHEITALIITPLFLPILKSMGVSPVHFGIVMTFGCMVANVTPPVGINLYIAMGIADVDIVKIMKYTIPLLAIFMVVYVILMFFPEVSLFLPNLLK